METLLIVDGHNLLFQMFFGMPARIINKDGKAIQGVLGFIGALRKIIQLTDPNYLVVLFDSEKREVRSDVYKEYKANRIDYSQVEEELNPFTQLPDIYSALDYLEIKHAECDKYETDDIIASYVYKYQNNNKIVISSFDSDYFQFLNDRVSILRYRGKKTIICDQNYVIDKYNVEPSEYVLFKSLVGDSADNIKGIERIGIKTASNIVNNYKTIGDIEENLNNIKSKLVKESLEKNIEQLKFNYNLIKLNDKAPIPFEINELVYKDKNFSTVQVLKEINLK